MPLDPTKRFSSRVENYIKYRPGYPAAVLDVLCVNCGLTASSVIADLGSGTGILSELFLKNGNTVFGVEPNPDMRAAGERLLAGYPQFTSIDGTAEATGLPRQSVDFITAGQAFHWFDRTRARTEFARILKSEAWIVLIWNERREAAAGFLKDYDDMLIDCGTDYEAVRHADVDPAQVERFVGQAPGIAILENHQVFDLAGIRGRLLSSSYTPEPDHPGYQPMLDRLDAIFHSHQVNGVVRFDYDTKVYYSRLAGA